ncbi:MAG: tripartite tricarboxylate transporter TctB family protein [Rhodoferax sp.]
MADRILGALCVLLAAGMAWAARAYAAEISYEPVGPRAFPTLLAGVLAFGGAWLLVAPSRPAPTEGAPGDPLQWRAVAMVAAVTLIYGALFQTLGFSLATALMAVPVGMAFGGTLKATALGGVGLGLGLYLLFDKVFDVVLPTGLLSFILGGR